MGCGWDFMLISIIEAKPVLTSWTIFIGVSIHKVFMLCFYMFYTTFAILRWLFIGVIFQIHNLTFGLAQIDAGTLGSRFDMCRFPRFPFPLCAILEENCVNFHSRGKRLRFAVGLRRVEDVHLIMQSDFDFIRHAIDAREQRGNFSFMAV